MKFQAIFVICGIWIGLLSNASQAAQIQIQLHGAVSGSTTLSLSWEDVMSAACRNRPCQLHSTGVTFVRNDDGISVLNVEVFEGATRVCLHGFDGAMRDAILYMNNGRRHKSRRGGNIHANGSGGCSDHKAKVAKAKVWRVKLE